ncbi:hypothetical protein BY996DRAFT_6527450 [Phakopsora pachyrhizi]|nr:hypothetical protein BY996DRAFT_6527450 [Phakopsora pachyrhizi]
MRVFIDAIADEVQKMNQAASKIELVVISKMDGKPDDVHDEEYHTMIKGMLSNKEFRKTLPAALLPYSWMPPKKKPMQQPQYLVITTKQQTPEHFLTASTSQQSKEVSMRMARDILLGNCNIDTLFQPSTHSQKQSNQECYYLSGGFGRADWILAWIDACNYDGTSFGLNVRSTLSPDPGWALIDDQLAKQLGVTTRTDDQISRPSVTPIKDSIGHHPPKEFSTYVKRRQVGHGGKRWSAQDKAQSILKHLDKRPTLTRPIKALEHSYLSEPHQT